MAQDKPSRSIAELYPHIDVWINEHEGSIEIGYDYNTSTSARALDVGGMIWGGGRSTDTLDDLFQALEAGIADWIADNF